MQRPFPTPVETWHNASYNAIDPQRPELSVADKVIIITGGGTGIGRETVKAFAAAGAKAIHVLGRTQASLAETRSIVEEEFPSVEVSIHVADVADVSTVEKAATVIGRWDVLVSNAGYLPKSRPIQEVDLADWWLGFEINVKGNLIVTKTFLPNRNPDASIVAVSSAIVGLTPAKVLGSSSYSSSKLAMIKFFEYVAAEVPDVQTMIVHPGVIETAMSKKSEMSGLPMDDVKLPAHFILWAASREATFAKGRFLWCNWDVNELMKLSSKIADDPFFSISGVLSWRESEKDRKQ